MARAGEASEEQAPELGGEFNTGARTASEELAAEFVKEAAAAAGAASESGRPAPGGADAVSDELAAAADRSRGTRGGDESAWDSASAWDPEFAWDSASAWDPEFA